jgi:formylglycine-generating enzyme required for sulfatase activity
LTLSTVEFESPTLDEKGQFIAQTRHAARQFIDDLGRGCSLEMILIPSGIFQMGSPRQLGRVDEQPRHPVTIKSFMMGKFLITQGQWKAIMGRLPDCRFKGDRLPVERVSWKDAHSFCLGLSKKTRRNYQLPSENQWEYACRAGSVTPFCFGETLTVEVANFNGEHTFRGEPRGVYVHATNEGGVFPPNAFGLCDMHGNLWEWCADNWLDDYSSSPRESSSYQYKDNRYRVARGGSWHEPPELCRSAARLRVLETEADEFMGLRVVCDLIDQDGL